MSITLIFSVCYPISRGACANFSDPFRQRQTSQRSKGHEHGGDPEGVRRPRMAAVSSCCRLGAISGDTLYVANLGDSGGVCVVAETEQARDEEERSQGGRSLTVVFVLQTANTQTCCRNTRKKQSHINEPTVMPSHDGWCAWSLQARHVRSRDPCHPMALFLASESTANWITETS
jgi:hypothetical protein